MGAYYLVAGLAEAIRQADRAGVVWDLTTAGEASLSIPPFRLILRGDFPVTPPAPAGRVLAQLAGLDGTLTGLRLEKDGLALLEGHWGRDRIILCALGHELRLSGRFPVTLAGLRAVLADPEGQTQAFLGRVDWNGEVSEVWASDPAAENFPLKRRLLEGYAVAVPYRMLERALFASTLEADPMPGGMPFDAVERYQTHGILLVPGLLDRDSVMRIQVGMDRHDLMGTDDTLGQGDWTADGRKAVSWYDKGPAEPLPHGIATHPALMAMAVRLAGAPLDHVRYLLKRVRADIGRDAQALTNEAWHADTVGLHCLRVIFYLSDAGTPGKGEFQYLPRTQNRPRQPEDSIFKALGGPGDAIFTDVSGLHRATRPTEGIRDTFQILYLSRFTNVLNYLFHYPTYVKDRRSRAAAAK